MTEKTMHAYGKAYGFVHAKIEKHFWLKNRKRRTIDIPMESSTPFRSFREITRRAMAFRAIDRNDDVIIAEILNEADPSDLPGHKGGYEKCQPNVLQGSWYFGFYEGRSLVFSKQELDEIEAAEAGNEADPEN